MSGHCFEEVQNVLLCHHEEQARRKKQIEELNSEKKRLHYAIDGETTKRVREAGPLGVGFFKTQGQPYRVQQFFYICVLSEWNWDCAAAYVDKWNRQVAGGTLPREVAIQTAKTIYLQIPTATQDKCLVEIVEKPLSAQRARVMKFVFGWKVAQFVRRCNANGLAPEVRQLQGHVDELASQYLPDSCEKHVLLRLRERVLDPKWRQSLSICQRTLPNRPAITKENLRKKAAILDHSRGAKSGGQKWVPKTGSRKNLRLNLDKAPLEAPKRAPKTGA